MSIPMTPFDLYKGKTVLVTGHTGFKGAWLSIWLELLGAKVVGYALDPEHTEGIFTLSGIANHIQDIRADVRNLEKLKEVFSAVQPDIVFHLAAQALVLESYRNPVDTFAINIQGTVNVLEAIRQTPSIKAAVMITTDKCYENKEWTWGYRENDPMGGHDPYSASKGAAELVISAYRRSFFNEPGSTQVASARAGNVIGGGDWSENRLVPDIIKSIRAGKQVEIRNPQSTRPWQHVLEPLSGYLTLGSALFNHPGVYAEGWNFGPYTHENHPVREVLDKMIRYAGKGEWKDLSNMEKQHEANLLQLDITKAIQKLHWRPLLSFDQAIRMTVDWYFNSGSDAFTYTKTQIEQYMQAWNSLNGN